MKRTRPGPSTQDDANVDEPTLSEETITNKDRTSFYFRLAFVPDATAGHKAHVTFTRAESIELRAQSGFFEGKYRQATSKTGAIHVSLLPSSSSSSSSSMWPLDLPPLAIDFWRTFLADGKLRMDKALSHIGALEKVALFALFDVAIALLHTTLAEALAALFGRALATFPDEAWFIVVEKRHIDAMQSSVVTYFGLRARDEADLVAEPAFNYLFPADNNAAQHGISEEARLFLFRRLNRSGFFESTSLQAALYLLDTGIATPSTNAIAAKISAAIIRGDDELVSAFMTHMEVAADSEAPDPRIFSTLIRQLVSILIRNTLPRIKQALAVFERIWIDRTLRGSFTADHMLLLIRTEDWPEHYVHTEEKAAFLALVLREDDVFTHPKSVPLFALTQRKAVFGKATARRQKIDLEFLKVVLGSAALTPEAQTRLVNRVLSSTPADEGEERRVGRRVASDTAYQLDVLKLLYKKAGTSLKRLYNAALSTGDDVVINAIRTLRKAARTAHA